MAERGWDVVLHCNRSWPEAKKLAAELEKFGVDVDILRADLSRESEVVSLARAALKKGPLDLLINNASMYERTPLEGLTLSDWNRCLRVNLTSAFVLSRKIGLSMRHRGGSIINIADTAGERPYRDYLPYCVSKEALLGLTRALAVELAPQVRVNAISPGPMIPPPSLPKRVIERLGHKAPLGRWGGPEEIAKAVVFVSRSDYMTGSNLVIDGGFSLV